MLDDILLNGLDTLASFARWQLFLFAVFAVGAVVLLRLLAIETYVSWSCRHIPCPDGRVPLIGHAFKLLK